MRCHPIRDYETKGIIKLEYTGTEHTVADIVAKPLQKVKHGYFTIMRLQKEYMNSEDR